MQLPDIATEARDFWVRESELKEFCRPACVMAANCNSLKAGEALAKMAGCRGNYSNRRCCRPVK
jgi:hypothetical protein